ncbi:cytochrome c [Thalassobius vesicularis]|uniref:Cytochrome c n=1 Tax=Thalassobius vesicularis TaxID=1294297 RepID=A0A4S3MD74_9RHOB|nr:cytochrome c [Thalassobius vesicularis]THD74981.1 cytochrome c [Thalassobius vesicularis]
MKKITTILTATILASAIGAGAQAESHVDKAVAGAIAARQATMKLYAFNLGLLGGMAKGEVAYDAAAASGAANNIALLTQLNQMAMWPEGSDEMSVDGTRALSDIWSNMADVMAKGTALSDAAATMQAEAGKGLPELQAAMGAVGGACGACHKAYRAPEK